jgi:hypothetical protein
VLTPLEASDYARLSTLFEPSFPNLAFVSAVLERKIPGQAWAEWDGRSPRSCLVTTGSPFCFIGGAASRRLLEGALPLLAAKTSITLVCPAALELAGIAAAHGFAVTERFQYGHARPSDGERVSFEIPEPYRLARIDAKLFQEVNWREMVSGIYGSPEVYLEHHYGFCLLHDGRLVAEAHGVVGGGLVEFGAFTRGEHRRRGLSMTVIAQVIRHGARLGHRAVASFIAGKRESQAIVDGFGLRRELAYQVLTLSR